jgi:PhnB protein
MENTTPTTTRPAHGKYTDNGIPKGSTSLTPFIAVSPAAQALDFYTTVFGATLISRTDLPGPDGTAQIAHAVVDFGHGRLELGEPNPAFHLTRFSGGDDVDYSLGLFCPDVDAVVRRAVEHGATVREPVTDFVSGDRDASIRDPFGVRWSVMTRIEDISEEESARRVAEWAASLSG